MNSKILISVLVLGLLPITAAPAEAGVYQCRLTQYKSYTSSGIKYKYKKICSLNGNESKGFGR